MDIIKKNKPYMHIGCKIRQLKSSFLLTNKFYDTTYIIRVDPKLTYLTAYVHGK